jgi:hypothetical protein
MLIPFVIDSDSLAPDPEWSPQTQRACYNDFIDAWMRTGLLAVDGDKIQSSNLWKSINLIPEKYRKRIQQLMEVCPIINIPNWKGSINTCDLEKISSVAQIALVDDTRAEIEFGLSVDDDEIRNNETNVFVCRFQAFLHSEVVREFKNTANMHIEKGDTYLNIWNRRFKNLANAPIKKISIVDRYAISRHFSTSQSKLSGLARFLKLLNDTASGSRYVTIYSAWTKELSNVTLHKITEELCDLQKKYNSRINRMEIYMAPNISFGAHAHDRFVRFHENNSQQYVWGLGEGLTVFEGPYSEARSSANFVTGDVQSYKMVENDIKENVETKYGVAPRKS